jgi:hypothetical protein
VIIDAAARARYQTAAVAGKRREAYAPSDL